jgi:hypothetical protein
MCISHLYRTALCFCAAAMTGTSAPVVDITVPEPYNFGQVLGTGQWTQSFTAESANAAGAGIWVFSTPSLAGVTGTVELRLFENLPTLGGSALATGSASVTLAGAPQFYDVFWTPVLTNVGTTYYVQIFHSLPTGAAPQFTGNTYPGGNAYNNSAAFVNFDAPIRIYTESGVLTPIPEPSALALLLSAGTAFTAMAFRSRLARPPGGLDGSGKIAPMFPI